MRQKLLAIAALLASGAGIIFVSWDEDPPEITELPQIGRAHV